MPDRRALLRRLHAAGYAMIWCDEAVVTDVVPVARLTREWVLRRAFALSGRLSARIAPRRLDRSRWRGGRCGARIRQSNPGRTAARRSYCGRLL